MATVLPRQARAGVIRPETRCAAAGKLIAPRSTVSAFAPRSGLGTTNRCVNAVRPR